MFSTTEYDCHCLSNCATTDSLSMLHVCSTDTSFHCTYGSKPQWQDVNSRQYLTARMSEIEDLCLLVFTASLLLVLIEGLMSTVI